MAWTRAKVAFLLALALSVFVLEVAFDKGFGMSLRNPQLPADSRSDLPPMPYAPVAATSYRLASALTSGMVLQRAPVSSRLWGFCMVDGCEEGLLVRVAGQAVRAAIMAGTNSTWEALLPPMDAGGPHDISITRGEEVLTLEDVLFGDVFLCTGQSNMLFTVMQSQESAPLAARPKRVRIMSVGHDNAFAAEPMDDLLTVVLPWTEPSLQSLGISLDTEVEAPEYFSAVAWAFGVEYEQLTGGHVPIGLVVAAANGAAIQTMSSPAAVDECLETLPHEIEAECCPWQVGSMWNGLLKPLLPMVTAGILFYQGESNIPTNLYYECAFPAFVTDIRGSPDHPVVFAMIHPFLMTVNDENYLTLLRQHQLNAQRNLPKTAIVVTSDLGDPGSPYGELHPRRKWAVGQRMAKDMVGLLEGEDVEPTRFVDVTVTEAEIRFSANRPLAVEDASCPTLRTPDRTKTWSDYCETVSVLLEGGESWNALEDALYGVTDEGMSAVVTSATLVSLAADSPVIGVRYCWADWPVPRFFDGRFGRPVAPMLWMLDQQNLGSKFGAPANRVRIMQLLQHLLAFRAAQYPARAVVYLTNDASSARCQGVVGVAEDDRMTSVPSGGYLQRSGEVAERSRSIDLPALVAAGLTKDDGLSRWQEWNSPLQASDNPDDESYLAELCAGRQILGASSAMPNEEATQQKEVANNFSSMKEAEAAKHCVVPEAMDPMPYLQAPSEIFMQYETLITEAMSEVRRFKSSLRDAEWVGHNGDQIVLSLLTLSKASLACAEQFVLRQECRKYPHVASQYTAAGKPAKAEARHNASKRKRAKSMAPGRTAHAQPTIKEHSRATSPQRPLSTFSHLVSDDDSLLSLSSALGSFKAAREQQQLACDSVTDRWARHQDWDGFVMVPEASMSDDTVDMEWRDSLVELERQEVLVAGEVDGSRHEDRMEAMTHIVAHGVEVTLSDPGNPLRDCVSRFVTGFTERCSSVSATSEPEHFDSISRGSRNFVLRLTDAFCLSFPVVEKLRLREAAEAALNDAVTALLYPSAWPMYIRRYQEKEDAIYASMSNLFPMARRPSFLGLAERFTIVADGAEYLFGDAVALVQDLALHTSPTEKLRCLCDVIRNICWTIEDFYETHIFAKVSIGSEDLLSLVVYVLVVANQVGLYSQCKFLEDYVNPTSLLGTEGYALATVETALNVVKSMEVGSCHR